jgi:flagellar motor component MotA
MKNKQIQNKQVQENGKVFKKVFMKPGRDNREDRLNFIKFWAEYIKTHSDEDWSKQQNIVIDSQLD